jgi:hypothetical protein
MTYLSRAMSMSGFTAKLSMASQSVSNHGGATMTTTATRQQQGIGSPISNEAYNVLSALHSKLEGLEAYRKYAQNGDSRLWQQLSQQDNQAVESLLGELERLMRDNKFRMQQPGRAG